MDCPVPGVIITNTPIQIILMMIECSSVFRWLLGTKTVIASCREKQTSQCENQTLSALMRTLWLEFHLDLITGKKSHSVFSSVS